MLELFRSRRTRTHANGVKDPPVEEDHDDTGDVEGAHGGVDEKVRVVKGAEGGRLSPTRGVVHPESYRGGDGNRDDPREREHHVDTLRVLVSRVLDGPCDSYKPVYRYV